MERIEPYVKTITERNYAGREVVYTTVGGKTKTNGNHCPKMGDPETSCFKCPWNC